MESRVERTVGGAIVPQMNAVVLDRFGGVDELVAPDTAPAGRRRRRPHPGGVRRGRVLGRGRAGGGYDGAFGVASTFPYVLGWDAAGTVAEVGRNVTRFDVGERVYAATMPVPRGGFYAEYGVVEAEFVARVPDRVPTEQAGAMAWDALTALSGLDLLGLRPDETLMVFGASGGIGHMAVQLARHSGIRVLAVASGDDGGALVRRLGADDAVDGRRDDVLAAAFEFAPGGLDAALVTVGGEIAERSLRAIKKSGRIAWPNGVLPAPVTSPGATVSHYDGDRSRTATDRLNAIIEASSFEVHVARTFPLERVGDAHRALNDHYVGKLALKVG